MGDDDRQNREGEDRQLVAMPYLFGYQKDHSGAKKQQRDQPLMMLAETMPERPRADGEGQGDHTIFKTRVVNDIYPKQGKAGHGQREDRAVDRAKNRGGYPERIPIDL